MNVSVMQLPKTKSGVLRLDAKVLLREAWLLTSQTDATLLALGIGRLGKGHEFG